MNDLVQDLRYGLRSLARAPLFTLTATLALALGIGSTTAIFSVANALLLRPIAAPEPERLVNLHARSRDGSSFHAFSLLDFRDLRRDNAASAELAAWSSVPVSLASGDNTRVAFGQIVSENYFRVFGVAPHQGRFFDADDAGPVAVVGHGFWTRRLGADPRAIGSTIHVNGRPVIVVGVAPRDFTGAFGVVATEVWLPLGTQPWIAPDVDPENRGFVWLELVGRLASGISVEQAEAAIDARYRELARATGRKGDGGIDLGAMGTVPGQVRAPVRVFVAVLLAIVGLVLLTTCVNVAGMLLGRAASRRREIAVRLALGAGRRRLVRQLLVESLLLFTLGGGLGLLVAAGATRLLLAVDLPLPVALALDLGLDHRVLAFALAVTLATGVLFGLLPALQASRPRLTTALAGGAGDDPRRQRLRRVFVAGQVALSLLLLIVAGLFLRALGAAAAIDPGFDPEGVRLATVDVALHGYDETRGRTFFAALEERVAALREVEAAALARLVPLGLGNSTSGINVPGHEPPADDTSHPVDVNTVGSGYFRTMGVPLLRGREFDGRDRADGTPVVVVNQTLAERFFPAGDAVGRRLTEGPESYEIVGVAADGKYRTLGEPPRLYVYFPLAQRYSSRVTLHVRAAPGVDEEQVAAALRTEISALDPHLPVASEMSLEEHMRLSTLPQRLASTLAGVLGVLVLVLAGLGVYGVVAVAVAQRTRELGVRVALGARPRDVRRLVLGDGLRLALWGAAAGLTLALAVTRLLRGLLYDVSPADPLVLAGATIALVVIVLLASFLPARRATAIDPLAALRHE